MVATSPEKSPPRFFGMLLAVLGLAFSIGGISLVIQGDNAYFLVTGLSTLASGILIALGKLIGAWLYVAVLAIVIIWSAIESANLGELFPRVLVPVVICIYIFSSRVRSRLS